MYSYYKYSNIYNNYIYKIPYDPPCMYFFQSDHTPLQENCFLQMPKINNKQYVMLIDFIN